LVFPKPINGNDDRNGFQNVLILIGFLGAIDHNNIDGTFLDI